MSSKELRLLNHPDVSRRLRAARARKASRPQRLKTQIQKSMNTPEQTPTPTPPTPEAVAANAKKPMKTKLLELKPAAALTAKQSELCDAQACVAEMQATLQSIWSANQRGIEQWQAAHPGKEMTWPGQAELVEWLLDRVATLEAQLREAQTEAKSWEQQAEQRVEDCNQFIARAEAAEAKVAELEKEIAKRDGELNDALRELGAADRERREAHMQSDRDAARADSCARECSELNAALTAERQHRERLEAALKEVKSQASMASDYLRQTFVIELEPNDSPLMQALIHADNAAVTAESALAPSQPAPAGAEPSDKLGEACRFPECGCEPFCEAKMPDAQKGAE